MQHIVPHNEIYERIIIRRIHDGEIESIVGIEQSTYPEQDKYEREWIKRCAELAPDLFLVAEDPCNGKIIGYVSGLSTNGADFKSCFRKDFSFYSSDGKILMILGFAILSEYKGNWIERKIMDSYLVQKATKGKKLVILLCHKSRVRFFKNLRFVDNGKSNMRRNGSMWHEMTISVERWGEMKCVHCGNEDPLTLVKTSNFIYCRKCKGQTNLNEFTPYQPIHYSDGEDFDFPDWGDI